MMLDATGTLWISDGRLVVGLIFTTIAVLVWAHRASTGSATISTASSPRARAQVARARAPLVRPRSRRSLRRSVSPLALRFFCPGWVRLFPARRALLTTAMGRS